MTDQLSLSIWLERHAQPARLKYFLKLLRLFPFSQREQPQSTISIRAIDVTEPPLLERPINGPFNLAEMEPVFNEYQGDDVSLEIDSWWDLWQFDRDWAIRPSHVAIACFGPSFDNGTERPLGEQENLRVEFGVDTQFLPDPSVPGSSKLVESNIKSLLHVVHEIESALPVRERRLETESGENFAERLQQTLTVASQRPS